MRGVKVTLNTKANENLYKDGKAFTATATGAVNIHIADFNITGTDIVVEGEYYTVSYYADADNLAGIPISEGGTYGYGNEYAGHGERISSYGWAKSPFVYGLLPWGTYKHKRIVHTEQATADMVGATSYNGWLRCDSWKTGTVKIYDIKIEKGKIATDLE